MTETAVAQKAPNAPYGEPEVQRGLIEVAACSGNCTRAAKHLEEDPDAPSIDQSTLWRWSRKEKVEDYERIRAEALPAITERAAEQHQALAEMQMEGSALLTAELIAEANKLEPKDKVNALGKMDIGSGIHTEKAQLLSGQPTHRADRSVEELLRGLAARGLQLGEKRQEADGSSIERVAVLGGESEAVAVPSSRDSTSDKHARS
jgi:hypothetical protein